MMKMTIPVNPFSRPGKSLLRVSGLVFHWVANPGTSAMANARYFQSLAGQDPNDAKEDRFASTHFIIDATGIIQCVPEGEMCYHVGAWEYKPGIHDRLGSYPNATTIGIELCHPDWSGKFDPITLDLAKRLAVQIALKHGLDPRTDFYRHYDVTGKLCPKHWVGHLEEWEAFKDGVARKIEDGAARMERGTPR